MTIAGRPVIFQAMEWILICLAAGVVALLAFRVLTAKRHGGDAVPGPFNFDKYKAEEFSRRGLFDKTKWR